MTTMTDVTGRASTYLGDWGWLQHRMEDEAGRVCIRGAVSRCASTTAQAVLTMAVLRADGHGEEWNDTPGRTSGEVRDYLASVDASAATLGQLVGPQHGDIAALIGGAEALTAQERNMLRERDSDSLHRARSRADAVAREHGRTAVQYIETPLSGEPLAGTVGDAVRALAVRDLTGTDFTCEDYDTLTRAWASVAGPAHPADQRTDPQ